MATALYRMHLVMASILSVSFSNNALKLAVLLVTGIFCPQDTFAQSNLQGMRMTSLRGRCLRVMTAGRNLPAQCSPDPANALLLNTSYPDGRSGFYIVTDGYILTFSGMGSKQIKNGPNSVVQPVDLILFNKLVNGDANRPTKLRASGICSYENPTRGIPTKIECNAQTEQGPFALEFLHNGKYPEYIGK
jgi:hypothetical protein